MARPLKNDIDSGIQNWDGKIDDNDEALFNAPIPIHEHVGDETDLEATFAAASYDRCLVWVDHTVHGWILMFSNNSEWHFLPFELDFDDFTSTTSQDVSHGFVRFSSTGTVDYDLLPAAQWSGRVICVRNDKSSGTLNIDPNGSEIINALGAGSPFVVPVGNTVSLFSTGTKVYASLMV